LAFPQIGAKVMKSFNSRYIQLKWGGGNYGKVRTKEGRTKEGRHKI
jgi:hypothetical protein